MPPGMVAFHTPYADLPIGRIGTHYHPKKNIIAFIENKSQNVELSDQELYVKMT